MKFILFLAVILLLNIRGMKIRTGVETDAQTEVQTDIQTDASLFEQAQSKQIFLLIFFNLWYKLFLNIEIINIYISIYQFLQ